MKSIRWPGFIAFAVLLGVLVGGALLFAGPLTKSFLESALSKMNGAKVDIADVDIAYSPLAIALNNMQVTDREQPMINAVQIGKASFKVSLGELLFKKIIIEEMSLNNIEVDTPRKTSGAIIKPNEVEKEKPATESSFKMPDIELPDITKILEIESLKTGQLIESLNKDLDSTKQNWQATYDETIDQAHWDALDARYKKIVEDSKGGTEQKIQAIKDAKVLRDELKKQAEKISQAKTQFKQDSDRLGAEIKSAKDGPKNDVKAIKDKYKIEHLDASNITRMLFGEQTNKYIALAQKWYQRVKPYLGEGEPEPEPVKRSEGRDIAFKEFNPKPGFYVGKAALDVKTARGQFEGSLTDVSSDQSISRKPTRFALAGKDMPDRKAEKINGEINYIEKANGFVAVSYAIQSYQLSDFTVSKSSKLAIDMASGLMDMTLQTRLQTGKIKGDAKVDFNQVAFKSNKTEDGHSLSSMLAASLVDIKRFNIKADFAGSLKELDMNIKSDLDSQLGTQLKTRFKERVNQFENELQAKVEAKYKEPLQKIEAQRQQLQEMQNKVDQKDEELKQRIADLENKIDQEKNAKEQELKSKADNEKDKLKESLKNKLFK